MKTNVSFFPSFIQTQASFGVIGILLFGFITGLSGIELSHLELRRVIEVSAAITSVAFVAIAISFVVLAKTANRQ